MTSVNTNASATTALRTLQSTNRALENTQNRISTGLKIAEAKDNAAYWAISTTLKSDNKSLSTVKDALNLGAATVDTAYQGLNKTLEILDDIKTKLTAGSGNSVDRTKIQSEVSELQEQLKSIANSSIFSGENWLSVNSDISGYSSAKSVVASFARDGNNAVTIGTINIDTSTIALIDGSSLNEGILDAGKKGNTATGGLGNLALNAGVAATQGQNVQAAAYAYTPGGSPSTATLAATITIDSNAFTLSLTDSTTFDTAAELVSQINTLIGSYGTASESGGVITIKSASTGTTSTVALSGISAAGGTITAGFATGTPTPGVNGTSAVATFAAYTAPFTLDSNDTIAFDLAANGEGSKSVVIDRATIDAALGKAANGRIGSVADLQAVVTKAIQGAGVANITVSTASSAIRLTSTLAGTDSRIQATNFATSKGESILNIDAGNATTSQIVRYIKNVNDAINKVTAAASTLGAVAKRIDLQKTFVDTLIDTIDKGVSNLIDADLNEESTRLQALQTKQQLGVQALSIANSSTQSVLRLFQ